MVKFRKTINNVADRMRQIVLDTETTGLEYKQGHRIVEIAAVEICNRQLTGNHFHQYLNPERDSDAGALQVHGLTRSFLKINLNSVKSVKYFLILSMMRN